MSKQTNQRSTDNNEKGKLFSLFENLKICIVTINSGFLLYSLTRYFLHNQN